jgi:hypothetical protein
MNPYETGSPIPNFSPIINNFVDNLVRLKTHQADIDMRGRQLAEQQRQFDIELPIKQREASVKEGNLDVARGNLGYHNRQLQMQTPEHLQPIKPSKVAMEFQKFKTAYGPAGDAFKSIYDEINNVAEAAPETTNLDAYEHAKVIWPAKRDDVISRLEKQITSEDFAKLPPTQQEAITNLYDMVKYDKTGDKVLGGMLFRRTAASKQQEDMNQKAELLAAKQDFTNKLTQQKFENAKELQDAKYQLLKDMKMAGVQADAMGRKIMQGAYMEQLRDVDKQLQGMNPLMYENDEAFRAARQSYEARRRDIINDLKELSGLPVKKPTATGDKALDDETAAKILAEAGGDPAKAREIAKKRGYKF